MSTWLMNCEHNNKLSGKPTTISSELASEPLDPEIRESLQQELEFNLNLIRKQYALFVSYIHDSIVDVVDVKSLRVYLMGLPALVCDDDKEEHKLLYGNIRDQLREADTVTKIIEVLLEDYCSFLNYEVFQCILDRFIVVQSTDSDAQKLEAFRYSEKLEAYLRKHKLSEFVQLKPGLRKIKDPSKKLILKFNIALPNRVTKVLDLKKAIAKVLNLKTPALQLVGIAKGCVLVTFLIPPYLAQLTTEQIQEIQSLSVLWFQLGDQVFDLSDPEISLSGT
jgi:hypothetical protein